MKLSIGPAYSPPAGGVGTIGAPPALVAKANYTAQTVAGLAFTLLAAPVTGDYTLNDLFVVTTAAFDSGRGTYTLTWADENGPQTLTVPNYLSVGILGTLSSCSRLLNVSILAASPLGLPYTFHAVAGTPIAVSFSFVPTGVLSAIPHAGNAGSNYTAGDTVTVNGGLAGHLAVFTIDTVDGGGAVVTGHISSAGAVYAVTSGAATTNLSVFNGAATGLKIDITALTTTSAMRFSYRATLVRNQ